MATAWTQAHLDKLEAAIATGARRCEFRDKELELRSLKDMLATRALIREALGLADSSRSRVLKTTHNRGLG